MTPSARGVIYHAKSICTTACEITLTTRQKDQTKEQRKDDNRQSVYDAYRMSIYTCTRRLEKTKPKLFTP